MEDKPENYNRIDYDFLVRKVYEDAICHARNGELDVEHSLEYIQQDELKLAKDLLDKARNKLFSSINNISLLLDAIEVK